MPAINFSVFIEQVENGLKQMNGEPFEGLVKRQTIRAVRKHPIKPGDRLYLYTGMRHKNCRKLGEADCRSADEIVLFYAPEGQVMEIRGAKFNSVGREDVAQRDGFLDSASMYRWFQATHGFPFKGQVIRW